MVSLLRNQKFFCDFGFQSECSCLYNNTSNTVDRENFTVKKCHKTKFQRVLISEMLQYTKLN